MQRKVVLAVSLLLSLFCCAAVYLWISNLRLKDSLKRAVKAKVYKEGVDLKQHKKLKESLRRDLEEKYRADMISYQAVQKRLEQKKVRQEP